MVEKYNRPQDKKGKKLIIFLVFLGLAFSLLYFAFSHSNITGVIIQESSEPDVREGKRLTTSLNSPANLSLDEEMSKIEITTLSKGIIYVGGKKTDLSKLKRANIVINNYSGSIFFNGKKIFSLEGQAEEVSVNDISISSPSGTTDINLEDLSFKKLKTNDIYLEELSYNTSGSVNVNKGKMKINLRDEMFKLDNFKGNLAIGKKFELDGKVRGLVASDVSIGE